MLFLKKGSLMGKAVAILFISGLFIHDAAAQAEPVDPTAALTSYPKMHDLITKKRKKKKHVLMLQVQWMDTLFQLERKQAGFITDVPVPKGSNSYYEIYREAPWDGEGFVMPHANCHSFGLEQSFRYAGIDALVLFSPTTYVDPAALEVLLLTAYQKQDTLDATVMKDLKQPIAPGSLLIFRDSTGTAVHTAFQGEEGILSKNGRYEPRIYHKLEHLKMVYYMATTIDIYQLEADRVREYLSEQGLQASLEQE
jgi:hypothetical protein